MSKNLKISAGLLAAFVAAVLVAAFLGESAPAPADPVASSDATQLVRPDSHRLSTAPDGKVTLVEFLDFECESCRAAFPAVEQLRAEYAGRVTFVVRYFPITSHRNAEAAAIAVEAAAQQGKFEAMYRKMYETQADWGEQQTSKASVFRGFAEELGLDMPSYDRAVADPKTSARVRRDRDDGVALGVQGTPTFFLNGQRLEVRSAEDLKAKVDGALGG